MICEACDDAKRDRAAGLYLTGCIECSMRGIARSPLMDEAVRTNDREPVLQFIRTAFPKLDANAALKRVWWWWRNDHPKT